MPADIRPGDGPSDILAENAAGKAQQFLRLPVESAKKLRWYDRQDLNNLVQQNLREKNDLLRVNAALRQVCTLQELYPKPDLHNSMLASMCLLLTTAHNITGCPDLGQQLTGRSICNA